MPNRSISVVLGDPPRVPVTVLTSRARGVAVLSPPGYAVVIGPSPRTPFTVLYTRARGGAALSPVTKSQLLSPSGAAGTPPFIGNWTPPPGTEIASDTAIGVDVVDPSGLQRITIQAVAPDGSTDTVWDANPPDALTPFRARYASSSRVVQINGGFRFFLQADRGWTKGVRVDVTATNTRGVES